jgi:hypothetical protein
MSKMDALRAMREAKYAAARAGAATPAPVRRSAGRPAPGKPAPAAEPAASAPAAGATEPAADPGAPAGLCGHRNMGGRTCTREQGHAAKSHRYS